MKSLLTLLLVTATVAALAVPALAGAPVNGQYKSEAGQVLHGRYSESYVAGTPLTVGNTMNTQSWDGATLGTQYRFTCPSTASTVLVLDLVFGGNGQQIWQKTYTGGTFWLNGTGEAWDGGDATYTGTIDTYIETVTIIFSGGVRVAATSNIAGSGSFNLYGNSCIQWTRNGADVMGASPPAYPDYLSPNCAPGVGMGRSGNSTDFTINVVNCVVPVDESTWGGIKALYE